MSIFVSTEPRCDDDPIPGRIDSVPESKGQEPDVQEPGPPEVDPDDQVKNLAWLLD